MIQQNPPNPDWHTVLLQGKEQCQRLYRDWLRSTSCIISSSDPEEEVLTVSKTVIAQQAAARAILKHWQDVQELVSKLEKTANSPPTLLAQHPSITAARQHGRFAEHAVPVKSPVS